MKLGYEVNGSEGGVQKHNKDNALISKLVKASSPPEREKTEITTVMQQRFGG